MVVVQFFHLGVDLIREVEPKSFSVFLIARISVFEIMDNQTTICTSSE